MLSIPCYLRRYLVQIVAVAARVLHYSSHHDLMLHAVGSALLFPSVPIDQFCTKECGQVVGCRVSVGVATALLFLTLTPCT